MSKRDVAGLLTEPLSATGGLRDRLGDLLATGGLRDRPGDPRRARSAGGRGERTSGGLQRGRGRTMVRGTRAAVGDLRSALRRGQETTAVNILILRKSGSSD